MIIKSSLFDIDGDAVNIVCLLNERQAICILEVHIFPAPVPTRLLAPVDIMQNKM